MIDEKKLREDISNYFLEKLANTSLFFLTGTKIEQFKKVHNDIMDIIENQPKADWIPCEERLPNEEVDYLVTR